MEIKQALNDGRFRNTLPLELRDDLAKYLQCPSCPANVNFFRRVLQLANKQLSEYYPGGELHDIEAEDKKMASNSWTVFSCHIDKLEAELKQRASIGRFQLAIARYEDQVTVVINQLPWS